MKKTLKSLILASAITLASTSAFAGIVGAAGTLGAISDAVNQGITIANKLFEERGGAALSASDLIKAQANLTTSIPTGASPISTLTINKYYQIVLTLNSAVATGGTAVNDGGGNNFPLPAELFSAVFVLNPITTYEDSAPVINDNSADGTSNVAASSNRVINSWYCATDADAKITPANIVGTRTMLIDSDTTGLNQYLSNCVYISPANIASLISSGQTAPVTAPAS